MAWILAHEGGWDEILLFGVPAVLAIIAVRRIERKARERYEQEQEQEQPVEGSPVPPPAADD